MTCNHNSENNSCPFAFTDLSERAQTYGCLPSPYEIVIMRTNHNKTWACHGEPSKPCIAAIKYLKEHNLSHEVIDTHLITEKDNWSMYVT